MGRGHAGLHVRHVRGTYNLTCLVKGGCADLMFCVTSTKWSRLLVVDVRCLCCDRETVLASVSRI